MSAEEVIPENTESIDKSVDDVIAEPTPGVTIKEIEDVEDDDEDLDETIGERLWGLTEMFPDWVRNGTSSATSLSASGLTNLLHLSRSIMWIFFSSSCVLIAPVLFEVERGQIEEAQKEQQRRILLGPNAAMSGQQKNAPGMMGMPPPPMAQQ